MKTRKIASPYILNSDGEFLKNGLLTFDTDGTLTSIDQMSPSEMDKIEGLEYHNGVIIAGMTNAHCHLELSYLVGQISEGGGLVEFIREITSIRGQWTYEQQIQKAIVQDRLMWAAGVQAVGDISNGTASFEAKHTSSIYYHTFAEYFNMPPEDKVDEYFAEKTAHMARARQLGLAISPTPHSTYMVSDKLFKKSAHSARCSVHFMETRTELDLFDKKGDMYDFLIECGMTPDFLCYGSHAARMVGSFPADMPLLLIHNTNCKESDVKTIMDYFTDVTFVLCPRSNYYIERAFPNAMMFHRLGARVALGTDSLTSNHSLDMAAEIEWLARHNPELPFNVILKWATAGGAAGVGRNDLGAFVIGTKPGAVLLEGVDFAAMKPTSSFTSRRLI